MACTTVGALLVITAKVWLTAPPCASLAVTVTTATPAATPLSKSWLLPAGTSAMTAPLPNAVAA